MSDDTVESLRQEIERLTQEKDKWAELAGSFTASQHHALREIERLTAERDHFQHYYHTMLAEHQKLQSTLAQAEQERDRLRAALEIILADAEGHLDHVVCLRHLSRIKHEAQQALSPKPVKESP